MAQYAAAIDQGTTSTRFMVFDHSGQVVSVDQKEHEQIYPRPGWVEHDPLEIWLLTGGSDGGVHVTDVSNASRTMLMNLETLDWDDEILGILGVPRAMLPAIRASSEVYGESKNGLAGIPVAGDLGDQQAALFG